MDEAALIIITVGNLHVSGWVSDFWEVFVPGSQVSLVDVVRQLSSYGGIWPICDLNNLLLWFVSFI